ncbi:hypothetical protein L9F63_005153, partial [Diploptera punctata]
GASRACAFICGDSKLGEFFCTMNVVLSFYLQPFASNKQLKLGPFERSTLMVATLC